MPILIIKTQVREDLRRYVGDKKYHDDNAVGDVIGYILRADKVPDGCMGGFAVNPLLANEQFTQIAQAFGKDFGVRLRHMILSFSPNEQITLYDAKSIAYQIAAFYGYNYQIVWACHTDANCLNIHMVMNTVSYRGGKKYNGSKADYYNFKSHIGTILSPYGMYLTCRKDEIE